MPSTARLSLEPMTPSDAKDLFPMFSDPDGWWFAPESRHRDVETTVAFLERAAYRWDHDGLSYWTARSLDDGRPIGVGGVQRHRSGVCWNLYYRIAGAEQRKGFATELARAGIEAGRAADPTSAVIAWIASANEPSVLTARKLGLTDLGAYVDLNDGQVRHAYVDRPFDPAPFKKRP
jgi:RimJ/RimL family protein N-acetyltransferase